MELNKYKEEYILSNKKLEEFYSIYNSKNNNIIIKDIFNYKDIKNNNFNYDEKTNKIYNELIIKLLDTLHQQLTTLNKILFDTKEIDINRFPNEINNILNNNNYAYKITDIINLYNKTNFNIDTLLYDLTNYCDILKDILEMFFENDKWYKLRENFLKSEQGKDYYKLYIKYFN